MVPVVLYKADSLLHEIINNIVKWGKLYLIDPPTIVDINSLFKTKSDLSWPQVEMILELTIFSLEQLVW